MEAEGSAKAPTEKGRGKLGGAAPVVVFAELGRGGIEERELGIDDGAGNAERAERGADAADEDFRRRGAAKHEAHRETRAEVLAHGDVDEPRRGRRE